MRFSTLFIGLLAVCFTSAAVTKEQFINDLNTLNYALALENFEAALYSAFTTTFPNAAAAGVNETVYTYLVQSRDAEIAHARDINATITQAGWIPAPSCVFTGAVTALGNNATLWLQTLTTVENLGAQAYTGATQYLSNNKFLQYAATVATVEARHASFLNALTGASPFPDAVETGLNVSQVFGAAGSFFTNCPKSAPTVCFDGITRNFSVLDHAPGQPYSPKPASSFRTATGTYAVGSGPKISAAAYARDTLVLQYALTAENLEDAFYESVLANVSRATFATYFDDANPLKGVVTSDQVYDLLGVIAAHESGHVTALNAVLAARGTSGVPRCSYPNNFALTGFNGTAASLLASSKFLENTGVGAYLGAITLLTDIELVGTAAGIALVEARHAAYLQLLTGSVGLLPGSNQNNDQPIFPGDVAAAVAPLLGTCPNNTAADSLNGGTYSSLDLPFAALDALARNTSKAGGYNDAADYINPSSSSSSTSTSTPGSGSGTRSSTGSALFVSVALVASFAAMLF